MTHRALALLLIFSLLLTPAALASKALGWELVKTDTVLGPGLTMTTQTLWGDSRRDYRVERYVTYQPGQGVEPIVCYGATLTTREALTTMAHGIEDYGYRVLAGANGDYFVMATGVPLGMVVTYGTLRSSSSYHYAVGFRADGAAFAGKPEMTIYSDFLDYHLAVSGGYNKTREGKSGSYLFSRDIGSATRGSGAGVNLILRPVTVPEDYVAPQKPADYVPPQPPEDQELPEDWTPTPLEEDPAWQSWQAELAAWKDALYASTAGFPTQPAQLKIGTSLTCVVESVLDQSGPVTIPEGRLVLSIAKDNDAYSVDAYSQLLPGHQVKLSVTTPDSRWTQAVTAIGAFDYILQNGVLPDGLSESADPRTALGVKADGSAILYTIDGRRTGYSVGASVRQVAQRLQELGCTDAVLLDGGGSTTFGATEPLADTFSLLNRPSDNSQRAVTNALFFLNPAKPTGELGSLYIEPQSALMLSGARLSLSAKGIDTAYYPMGGGPVSGVTYTAQGPGRVEGATFIAGAERGTATITATAEGGAQGAALISVVDTPDVITLTSGGSAVTALNLDPGQQVSLDAAATWYKLPLMADDRCFTWTVTGGAGTVDALGNLTAGAKATSGALTVSAGARELSIPLLVGGHVYTLENFEDELMGFDGEGGAAASLSAAQVRFGSASLRVDYPLTASSAVTCALPIQAGESRFGLWAFGDGSPLKLEAVLRLADGSAKTVLLSQDPFTGWKQLQADIPEDTAQVLSLTLTPGDGSTGTLYLDQIISANGPIYDLTPPTVALKADGSAASATLSDNVDKTFYSENVSLTMDGQPVECIFSGRTLTALLDRSDGKDHRLSLTVTDASGNRSRSSLDLPGWDTEAPLPFDDIDGHWAQGPIAYLYHQGVTNGRLVGDRRVFDPGTNITRGEFAAMLARWLRADLTGYAGARLPFADAASVPSWAVSAVAYLSEAGIMTGSLEKGKLYANANDPITRAQAMTMLGRVQAKGFAPAREVFSDDDAIPAWARDHVYTLAGQGVVSGYEGRVRPQDPITRCEVAKLLTSLW